MKKRKIKYVAVCMAVFCLFCGCSERNQVSVFDAKGDLITGQTEEESAHGQSRTENGSPDMQQADGGLAGGQQTEEKTAPAALLVHICGAVQNPGVYELSEGDRVCHVIEAAGGFAKDADEHYLNQAHKLTDGMQIYIPTKEETVQMTANGSLQNRELPKESTDGLVNINTATLEQLCSLPGIGEGKAQNIIAYREEKGSYTSIEEIMNVEGIKEGLFEKIRDKITVS